MEVARFRFANQSCFFAIDTQLFEDGSKYALAHADTDGLYRVSLHSEEWTGSISSFENAARVWGELGRKHGTVYADRFRKLEEQMRALREIWTNEEASLVTTPAAPAPRDGSARS